LEQCFQVYLDFQIKVLTLNLGRHALPKDEEGYYFVDKDGTHFRHILNFLRDPDHFEVDLSKAHLKELKKEALYYGLLDHMFPFVPANERITDNLSGYNVTLTIKQNDSGLWYISNEVGGGRGQKFEAIVATCCRNCKTIYVQSRGMFYGVRSFLNRKWTIHVDNQPRPERTPKMRAMVPTEQIVQIAVGRHKHKMLIMMTHSDCRVFYFINMDWIGSIYSGRRIIPRDNTSGKNDNVHHHRAKHDM
jgi:hypothetical protein